MQKLLSLPPNLVKQFKSVERARREPEWFVTHDPVNQKLGSGGGTAYLLEQAWLKTGRNKSFSQWLNSSCKTIIHGGGQSRRLPAYGPSGKLFTPIPVFRWKKGQRIDQNLLDLQLPFFESIFDSCNPKYRCLIASGDVINWFEPSKLKVMPDADVLCFGIWVEADQASHHGVFFTPKKNPSQLEFVLQKPTPEEVRKLAVDYYYLIDIGIWLLNEKALLVLMKKCGWKVRQQRFRNTYPSFYDIYGDFGVGFGSSPSVKDKAVNGLKVAIYPLSDGKFLHFGKNSDLLTSSLKMQNMVLDQRLFHNTNIKPHPNMFTQNAIIKRQLNHENHHVWIENSFISKDWKLTNSHIITGIPENDWKLSLPPGLCLDIIPIGKTDLCIRPYGIEDTFRGALREQSTTFLSRPLDSWLKKHKLTVKDLARDPELDIQFAKLFPVLKPDQVLPDFIQWMISADPHSTRTCRSQWLKAERLSADDINNRANIRRLYDQRRYYQEKNLPMLAKNYQHSVFYQLDLKDLAGKYAKTCSRLPDELPDDDDVITKIQDQMFRAEVNKQRRQEWQKFEKRAYCYLAEAIVRSSCHDTTVPRANILRDQIIWGRSPVRLDIAGGWSDTPPYCIINGGQVVNVAVDLNGQPPIQVFAKLSDKPHVVLRSIDLGREIRITSSKDLENYNQVGDAFSIPKAALCLTGFSPLFQKECKYRNLAQQLKQFGGGIELTFLAAVPKGSGLGTSSILAATIIKTLSDLCSLFWDDFTVSHKTLVLEQMLTTGGGWQDQLGGIFKGLKLLETNPGIDQTPTVKWLPDHIFTDISYKQNMLLYYTGITRVAKNILAEIVRGMFLNSQQHLAILEKIYHHAEDTYQAFQRSNWAEIAVMVQKSWHYNQQLDSGTNSPEIQMVIDGISGYHHGLKLLGAGGGGYMLIFAKDRDAAERIRKVLSADPPNGNARFVDFSISQTGTQVTRS